MRPKPALGAGLGRIALKPALGAAFRATLRNARLAWLFALVVARQARSGAAISSPRRFAIRSLARSVAVGVAVEGATVVAVLIALDEVLTVVLLVRRGPPPAAIE